MNPRVALTIGIALSVLCTGGWTPAKTVKPELALDTMVDKAVLTRAEAFKAGGLDIGTLHLIRSSDRSGSFSQASWAAVSGMTLMAKDASIHAYYAVQTAKDVYVGLAHQLEGNPSATVDDTTIRVTDGARTNILSQVGNAIISTTCLGEAEAATLCALQLLSAQAGKWARMQKAYSIKPDTRWYASGKDITRTLLPYKEAMKVTRLKGLTGSYLIDSGLPIIGETLGQAYRSVGMQLRPDSVKVTQYGSKGSLNRSWGSIPLEYEAHGWKVITAGGEKVIAKVKLADLTNPVVSVTLNAGKFTVTGTCMSESSGGEYPIAEKLLIDCASKLALAQKTRSQGALIQVPS